MYRETDLPQGAFYRKASSQGAFMPTAQTNLVKNYLYSTPTASHNDACDDEMNHDTVVNQYVILTKLLLVKETQ